MRIELVSIFVDDQDKALKFYTEVLGFLKTADMAVGGGYRWITVASPERPEGANITLEPSEKPWVQAYKKAAMAENIPLLYLSVDDIQSEYQRLLAKGVRFSVPPTESGPIMMAVFDDTCGNLVMLGQLIAAPPPDD
ncbi:MAG: VOC family protein [Anaerolineae bacterium]